jgi:hypothetical protein
MIAGHPSRTESKHCSTSTFNVDEYSTKEQNNGNFLLYMILVYLDLQLPVQQKENQRVVSGDRHSLFSAFEVLSQVKIKGRREK